MPSTRSVRIDGVSETAQQPGERPPASRGNPAMGDIVRSVLVLALAIVVVAWVAGLFRSDTVVEPETVDYLAVAQEATAVAPYELLAPSALPAGWRATQAEWDPATDHWHLGLLTEDDEYVGVEQQRDITVDELVETYAEGSEPEGDIAVGGLRWLVFVDPDEDRTAIVSRDDEVATMVLGSASATSLGAFAQTLQPVVGAAASGPGRSDADPSTEPEAEPEPEPPHPVSIQALVQRDYDGRGLRVGRVLGDYGAYTRYYATYLSGDLRISGVLNVPAGKGPFPALVLNHGYIDPADYVNGQGLSREQDYLARRGFVVLHTDYRNHAGSETDPANDVRMRLGYTVDVVNAVLALRRSDLPVDLDRMGLLGRSMGGGVTYNALVARPGLVDAGVVYAPVSSLAVQNFDRWIRDDPEDDGLAERIIDRYGSPQGNPAFWRNVSPRPFFDRITEPVLIHHGTADTTCPPVWSHTTLSALQEAGVRARLVTYPGEEHAFIPLWEESMQRTVAFLDANLS